MGAVQKLATVVIIGLVALATVLTVYIANEPGRRGSELTEQEEIAIVRGTDLYIQYCLQCHGPAGLGSAGGEDTPRVGAILNQEGAQIPVDDRTYDYHSDEAAMQTEAENFIRYRLEYGAPGDPRLPIVMPAFANELNVEEINELVFMLQNADWNYVYNTAVHYTGESVAEAECSATPVPDQPEYCGNIEDAPPLYPTAPPPTADPDEEEDSAESEPSGDAVLSLEAQDPATWSETAIAVAPGDTIEVTNTGGLQHNFVVEDLGIEQDLPNGEPVMVTIPDDAEPGEYEFICSIPGHELQGMVGTITIEG